MEEVTRVEEEAWPLVVVRVPPILDAAAIQSMFRGLDRVIERRSKFALLVDTRAMKQPPNAVDRKLLAQWMQDRMAAEALYNMGNAVVIASPFARAALTAIHWLRRPVTAQCFVSSAVEGIDWCRERLHEKGVRTTPAIDALRARET